jgi:IMP dehydrogenase
MIHGWEGYRLTPTRARPPFPEPVLRGSRESLPRNPPTAYNGALSSISRGHPTMRILEEALTFDDVLLVPAYSNFLPRDADLSTQLTRAIRLNLPIMSAAMDTVTEARLAITIAQEGGIGIIHKNMSIEAQAREVARVKKFESGVIHDPITISPDKTIREVLELTRAKNISGVPVVVGSKAVGIVTHRDLRFETKLDAPVSTVMTPQERLITVRENAPKDEVLALLHKHRIEKVLVVDSNFNLKGMITVKDFQKATEFPNAAKDERGALRVGAAVGTGADTLKRVAALREAGVDVIIVDTAHGHSSGVLQMVREIKKTWRDQQIIGGNIVTAEAALALVEAGADGVKVGIGPGSICTTRIVAGVGVPQITAVANVAAALKDTGVPLIADGGIRFSGDIAKALVAGAHSVMAGGLFAGTEESPGEVELYQGASYKSYRGMGSLGAMSQSHGSKDRYFQDATAELEKLVPEGVEGRVPYKGSVITILHQLAGGLRAAMGYTGCQTIEEMRTRPQFVRITNAGVRESHVHDVTITKEAPNYRVS